MASKWRFLTNSAAIRERIAAEDTDVRGLVDGHGYAQFLWATWPFLSMTRQAMAYARWLFLGTHIGECAFRVLG